MQRHVLQLSTSLQELLVSSLYRREVIKFLVWPSAVCCLLSSCELLTAGFKLHSLQLFHAHASGLDYHLSMQSAPMYVCCQLCLQCKELYHHASTLKDLDRRGSRAKIEEV
jgi:hypothetical protein